MDARARPSSCPRSPAGTHEGRPCDPSLSLTRTQHLAILGNRENRKPFTYARFASVCNAQQPLTDSRNEQVSGSSPLVGSLQSA